jgi:hypothetical protein
MTSIMPNALTHYTFAKEVQLDEGEHLDAAYLGAQGPDPFFFYGVISPLFRPKRHDVNSLGGITQHGDVVPPYKAMMDYARKSPDKELLFAYIDGLFMHYVVDSACHPYIFYSSGFTDRIEDSAAVHLHYNYSHMCLEVTIDFLLAHERGTFQRIDKVLALSSSDLKAISRMWWQVNQTVQKVPHIHPLSFYYAVKDYRFAEKHAEDRSGKKKAFLEKVFGKESYAGGMIFPQNLEAFKGIDFLNRKHAEWRMPDGTKRTESFDDLLEGAKTRYRKFHALLLQAKAGQDVTKALEELSAGLNHEGIIPNSPKLYWKLIWPKDFLDDYPGVHSR